MRIQVFYSRKNDQIYLGDKWNRRILILFENSQTEEMTFVVMGRIYETYDLIGEY